MYNYEEGHYREINTTNQHFHTSKATEFAGNEAPSREETTLVAEESARSGS